jgi:hypothetical protein
MITAAPANLLEQSECRRGISGSPAISEGDGGGGAEPRRWRPINVGMIRITGASLDS